jgi:hypothetical protein
MCSEISGYIGEVSSMATGRLSQVNGVGILSFSFFYHRSSAHLASDRRWQS